MTTAISAKNKSEKSPQETPMEVDGGSATADKKEQDVAAIQEVREQLRQIEKSVSSKESR